MIKSINRAVSMCAVAAATLSLSPAAGAQTPIQGVTLTPSWSGNVLTLEINAENPSDDWSTADHPGALHITSICTWDSAMVTGRSAAGTPTD